MVAARVSDARGLCVREGSIPFLRTQTRCTISCETWGRPGFDREKKVYLRATAPTLFKRATATANDNAAPVLGLTG